MLYRPTINPTTETMDIINELVSAVQAGERSFVLGRYVAAWSDGAWRVRESGSTKVLLTMGGNVLLPVPTIVRCWMEGDWRLE